MRQRIVEFLKRAIPDRLRNYLRPIIFRGRRVRVASRSLRPTHRLTPRFLIIGAMKAGTTSIFNYIATHAAFRGPVVKEIDYFNFNSQQSTAWYRAHFPSVPARGGMYFTGEASTGYLSNPRAAQRVHRLFPDIRIIVMLRDPVDRAISHYFHEVRAGREQRSLADAIRAPEADAGYTLSPNEEYPYYRGLLGAPFVSRADAALVAAKPLHLGYVFASRYNEHLSPWLSTFAAEQILVINSDGLFSDLPRGMAEVFEFLDLEAQPWVGEATVYNQGKNVSDSTAEKRYLRNLLADSDKQLDVTLRDRNLNRNAGFTEIWESGRAGSA